MQLRYDAARMNIRFYRNPETDEPHIHGHSVIEDEVADVLESPGEDRQGREGSRESPLARHEQGVTW